MTYSATPENIAAARAIAFEMWRERQAEHNLPVPEDLSNACVFSSLLCSLIFGAQIQGNSHHFFSVLPEHGVLDLNHDARDVQSLRDAGHDPHRHHRRFMASKDVRDQIRSCRPRVERWADEFRRRHRLTAKIEAQGS